MKVHLYSMGMLITLACATIQAEEPIDNELAIDAPIYDNSLSEEVLSEESLPFQLNAQRLRKNDPLLLYGNIRLLYGQGIDTNDSGKMRGDLEQIRIGMRYQRDLWYDWFFKGDMRGVFIHRNFHNDDDFLRISHKIKERYFFM